MGVKISVNHQAIADALIKSGDLDRDDCACGLEYKHDRESELLGLIDLALNAIAIFGAAGLRDLAIHANELADEEEFRAAYEVAEKERRAAELDLKVRADAQAKAEAAERARLAEDMVAARNEIERAERARIASGAELSYFDQMSLMCSVGSVGGDFAEFDFVRALVLRGVFTAPEINKFSREQMRQLLS